MQRYITALILSGTALALMLPFLVSYLWWTIIVGVAGVIALLYRAASYAQALRYMMVVFFCKAAAAIGWFWSVYPLTWITGLSDGQQIVLIFWYWVTCAFFIAIGTAPMVALLYFVQTSRYRFVFLPLGIVVAESVGALTFSIGTIGQNIIPNIGYTFGGIGYPLVEHGVLRWVAVFGGLYTLTIMTVLLGLALYAAVPYVRGRLGVGMATGTLLLFFGTSGISIPASSQDISVAVIDTYFSNNQTTEEGFFEQKTSAIQQAVAAAVKLDVEYVVLPEDARYVSSLGGVQSAQTQIGFLYGKQTPIIIDSGAVTLSENKKALRAFVVDVQEGVSVVDKQYLVPQGEFMPYFYSATLRLFRSVEVVEQISERFSFVPGPLTTQPSIPVLFCFESAHPLGAWRIATSDTPFIAHPISHAWFNNPSTLWFQLDRMLRVQSLFAQTPIVSAGNMAQGALYTNVGTKVVPTEVVSGEDWTVSVVSW